MLARKKRMGTERAEGNGECVFRYFVLCYFDFSVLFYLFIYLYFFFFCLFVRSFVLTLCIVRHIVFKNCFFIIIFPHL